MSIWPAPLQLINNTNKFVKIDMEKLAENLQKMGEDDLLVVVQMIHDNKSSESWTKNDVERKSHGAQLPRSQKINWLL